MKNVKELQLMNIRSLKDTGAIPILPITVLVGENSSGKSTFLRIFPLIKQSIQKKTNGPILWAGDVDDYVDFGSFEETVTNDGSKWMSIGFSFDAKLNEVMARYYWSMSRFVTYDSPIEVKYSIQIEKKKEKEYVSSLVVELNDTLIQFDRIQEKNTSVQVDNQLISFSADVNDEFKETESYYLWRAFSGRSIFGIRMPAVASWILRHFNEKIKEHGTNQSNRDYTESSLFAIGEGLVYKLSLNQIKDIYSEFGSNSKKSAKREITSLIGNHVKCIIEWLCSLSIEEQQIELNRIKLLYFAINYFSIEEYIREYFSQVHYIAPIRATAERYYRLRNSAIDEVDYQGKNLAIFLNSLPESRLIQFQDWTAKHFGFKASVSRTEGHLSIDISRVGQEKKINLSDTGFGYSQILPIITQLWELSSRKKAQKGDEQIVPLVVAIEQPELHLHPAMQARLAEAFIACIDLAKENGYSLQLILETHSETMINYFGRAIASKTLKCNDVAVVLFTRDENTGCTVTSTSSYDDEGYLTDWPIGFFAPED